MDLNKSELHPTICKFMNSKTRSKFQISPNPDHPPLSVKQGKGRKPAQLENNYHSYFSKLDQIPIRMVHTDIENILVGICSLNWYKEEGKQNNLSYKHILRILSVYKVITVDRVSHLLNVQERQARRYVQAIKLAMPYIDKVFINQTLQFRSHIRY